MKRYRKILKRKTDHYGYTEAAIEFAIEEYAKEAIEKTKEIAIENYYANDGKDTDIIISNIKPEKVLESINQ